MDRQSKYTDLLQRHFPMVWHLCWVRARGDYERCRDLVQEVSIALWLHLDGLRQGVSAKEEKAWVRWLTRTTLDHLHRSQRPPMLALTDAMAETLPDADNTAVAEDIEELMAALSPEEQQLMRLHIEGYRADEIAEAMGLRREAVYQRMAHAASPYGDGNAAARIARGILWHFGRSDTPPTDFDPSGKKDHGYED